MGKMKKETSDIKKHFVKKWEVSKTPRTKVRSVFLSMLGNHLLTLDLSTKACAIAISDMSIMELKSGNNKKFKVTRRIPELSISETKIFTGKEKAKRQFYEWLK